MKFKLKHKRRWAFYGLITVSLVGLIIFILKYPVSSFDYYITREIQKLERGNFTSFMTFVSLFGNAVTGSLAVIFASLVFFLSRRRREAQYILAVLITDLLNLLIKLLIHRPRPTVEDAMIMLKYSQSSFPSGHVVHYVVFFGFLLTVMIVDKKIPSFFRIFIGVSSAVLILTISISRLYLGAHWVTDVLGAYLFGFFYLGVLLTFYLKLPEGGTKLIRKIMPIEHTSNDGTTKEQHR